MRRAIRPAIWRTSSFPRGVSSPTVYNLVGGRREILVAAINDHTMALGQFAKCSNEHPHFLLGLAMAYWSSARAATWR